MAWFPGLLVEPGIFPHDPPSASYTLVDHGHVSVMPLSRPPPGAQKKKKKLQHTTIMPRCRTAIVAYTRFTYYLVELQRYHTICKYVFLLSTAMVPVRLLSPYPFRPPCHHSRRFLLRGVASASLPPHMPSHQKTVRRLDDHATLLILAPFSTAVGRSNLFAPNNNGELSMDASRARNTLRSSARH